MENFESVDTITQMVRRIFAIDDSTVGGAKESYLYRFRGHLVSADSAAAYDQLTG